MQRLIADVHHAFRRLRRTPGFTAVAGLTLALGLGANIAIFTVLYGVVLRPLPFHEPDRLHAVWHAAPGLGAEQLPMSGALFVHYRDAVPAFESLALYAQESMNLTGVEIPVRLTTARVSSELFATLGAAPALGRDFRPDDEQVNAPGVVILSDGFWRERFGGDPEVLGRTVILNGDRYEIVGVMRSGFAFPTPDVRLWRPVTLDPRRMAVSAFDYQGLARLAPGATPTTAARDLDASIQRLPDVYPNQIPRAMLDQIRVSGFVTSYQADVIGDVSTRLWILLGMVGLVLLIACANVANLFLVRAEARRREIALRTALGATPRDLAGVFFAEAGVLAAASGVFGVGAAWAAVRIFVALGPQGIPRLEEIGMSWAVMGYAAGVSLAAAAILGALPFIRGRGAAPLAALQEGGRSGMVGRRRHLARHTLVVAQVAMAMVLMTGSGLLLRSFVLLRNVDPGFTTDDVMTMRVALPPGEYASADDVDRFYRQLRDGVREIEGVRAAGLVDYLPLTDASSTIGFWIEGISRAGSLPLIHDSRIVVPGYFDALRIPILYGRALDDRDALNRTNAVVVSEAFAREHWNTADVVGRRIKSAQGDLEGREPWSTIVGVAGDVRSAGLAADPGQTVYWPARNAAGRVPRAMTLTAVSALPDAPLIDQVRGALSRLDPNLPLAQVQPLGEVLRRSMAREAFTAFLLAVAAGLALVLGAVGIYGVISFIYAQRAPELGVRMALGAEARDVATMVVRQSAVLAITGIAVGLVGSLAAARVLRGFLYQVSPYDPRILVTVPLLLAGVAVAASLLPARRASRVDPALVMRSE